jgi:uncharacterized membrane protein
VVPLLSIQGVFRTVLIIIAVIVILRFIGRVMVAKREADKQRAHERQRKAFEKAKKESQKNKGRVTLGKPTHSNDIEDVDFEEVR